MNELLDKFEQWARKAWNWLSNFIKKWWGRIRSWMEKFRQWAISKLLNKDEVVVIKPKVGNGRDLYEAIKKYCPNTTSLTSLESADVIVTASVKDGEIVDIEELSAETQQRDGLDNAIDQQNGVIRIDQI